MLILNKSSFNGMEADQNVLDAAKILNAVNELKEYTKTMGLSGPQFNYEHSDKEVIIIDDDGYPVRVDISDIVNADLDAVGTKLKMYFDTKPENYDPTLINLVTLINETKGMIGPEGKSPYEIAKELGFEGTEEEWLQSLRGGPGKSAYEISLTNGFIGSEEEWLNSILGKSSYEIWLEEGHIGSKEDYTKWVKAEAGGYGSIGEIFWWPLDFPPGDSLYCDGREIDRNEYIKLFSTIGIKFGSGNGTTTFNLPDLRGEFIRGYDPTNVRDPDVDRKIGTHQEGTGVCYIIREGSNVEAISIDGKRDEIVNYSHARGNENSGNPYPYFKIRPTNMNLLPCIRYKKQETQVVSGILSKIEYASNDDLSNADNNINFVNSEQGSKGINIDLTTELVKAVKFKTQYNSLTDVLELQLSTDQINWYTLHDVFVHQNAGIYSFGNAELSYGLAIYTSGEEISLMYGRTRAGKIENSWSLFTTPWYWRITKKTFVSNSIPLMNSPHLWSPWIEYEFEDGSFGKRLTGSITQIANTRNEINIQIDNVNTIISEGGCWNVTSNNDRMYSRHYINDNSGASSGFRIYPNESVFVSISSVDRTNALYDIWIRYTKKQVVN